MERLKIKTKLFNGIIWDRVPKSSYIGRDILEPGLFGAVANFKMGASALLEIFVTFIMNVGKFTENGWQLIEKQRLYSAECKELDSSKKTGRKLRGTRK